jgi:hypothetical protein
MLRRREGSSWPIGGLPVPVEARLSVIGLVAIGVDRLRDQALAILRDCRRARVARRGGRFGGGGRARLATVPVPNVQVRTEPGPPSFTRSCDRLSSSRRKSRSEDPRDPPYNRPASFCSQPPLVLLSRRLVQLQDKFAHPRWGVEYVLQGLRSGLCRTGPNRLCFRSVFQYRQTEPQEPRAVAVHEVLPPSVIALPKVYNTVPRRN